MSKYFTVVTAGDQSMDGKSFYTGQAKTEQKSIDMALENFMNSKYDDTVISIRTYDDIGAVSLKSLRQ